MDANTFEILHCHEVGKNEVVMSLRSCELGGQEKRSYYAVGTALIYDDETEAKLVNILFFFNFFVISQFDELFFYFVNGKNSSI